MSAVKQLYQAPALEDAPRVSSVALYDRYGAMAYGIILQIIPDTELAQRVLVDLFSSPQVKAYAELSHRVSNGIIRLAREKALAAKPAGQTRPLAVAARAVNDTSDKSVFDLSFYKGYSIDEIADKLELSRSIVLTKICAYLKQQRSA